jgi:methionine synthase II (cobalamin-independent)
LVFYSEFNEIEQAIAFEKQVKVGVEKKRSNHKDNWEKLKNYQYAKIIVIQIILIKIKASTPLSLTMKKIHATFKKHTNFF